MTVHKTWLQTLVGKILSSDVYVHDQPWRHDSDGGIGVQNPNLDVYVKIEQVPYSGRRRRDLPT